MQKHIYTCFFLLIVPRIYGQLIGDFESWSALSPTIYQIELEDTFQVQNPLMGIPSNWDENLEILGISRTTDAYEGDYAIILHNWYFYINQKISFKTSIQDIPQSLSGYYKFLPEDYSNFSAISPNGLGEIIISNAANEVVSSVEFRLDTASTYQYFEVDISQEPNVDFDSIQITIYNTEQNLGCLYDKEICNLLFLDGLALNYATNTSGLVNQAPKVFPNPTTDKVNIEIDRDKLDKVLLYDLYGNFLKDFANQNEISLDEFTTGIYFIKIYTERETRLTRVFKL